MINLYQSILNELSSLCAANKYEDVKEVIYLHEKSVYVIGKNISAEIDLSTFTDTSFKMPIYMPITGEFELSDNVSDELESDTLYKCKKQLSKHCDTLVFLNKKRITEFINNTYNSFAKQNKIVAHIEVSEKIFMSFSPVKKSTSVSSGEIDEPIIIVPRPRIRSANAKIDIKLLPLSLALNNLLLADTIKLEIDRNCEFVRISCFYNGLKVKFSILNNESCNF